MSSQIPDDLKGTDGWIMDLLMEAYPTVTPQDLMTLSGQALNIGKPSINELNNITFPILTHSKLHYGTVKHGLFSFPRPDVPAKVS